MSQTLGVFLVKLFAWQRRRARAHGIADPHAGAITFVQIAEAADGHVITTRIGNLSADSGSRCCPMLTERSDKLARRHSAGLKIWNDNGKTLSSPDGYAGSLVRSSGVRSSINARL